MKPGIYPITARQGTRFKLRFNLATNNVGIPLTNYSAAMQVRKSVTSSTTLLNLVSPTNISLNAGNVDGDVLVTVSGATMATLPAGTWVYDIELTDPSGNPEAVLEGKFIVKAEVTR
jgi:hypothetical protein